MTFSNTHVYNELEAIRAMRYSYDSVSKMDSRPGKSGHVIIGPDDEHLIRSLIGAGPSHRKFMREILVSVDITAPRFWWIEFDTYKVGVTAMSESTMHTLMRKPLVMEDFELMRPEPKMLLYLNNVWHQKDFTRLITLLPQSYKQKRHITMNYEAVLNMYEQRKRHKLPQWSFEFVNWVKRLDNASLFFPGVDKNK